jgi:acetyl-CoA carboxylase biotin carboxyl carrier protein
VRSNNRPDIDEELVHKLAKLLDQTGLTEIEFGTQAWHLRVAKGGTPGATAPASPVPAARHEAPSEPAAPPEADDFSKHPGLLTSPMVGVVYTLPEPDAPVMVRVGDQVAEGQSLLLIEAMKVFNPIKAHRAGTVTRIFVSNGAPVEYGEPLLIIE